MFWQLRPGSGETGELVDLISTIGFRTEENATDVLGEVYEYFRAIRVGGGQERRTVLHARHVARTLVEALLIKGVYDPCGSGGMFVQSERFVEARR